MSQLPSLHRQAGVGPAGGRREAAAAHAGEPPEDSDVPGAGRDRVAAADGGTGQTRQDLQPRELQGRF